MVQHGGAGSTRTETSQDQISSPHELSEWKYRNEYPAAEDCQSRPLDLDQKKLIDTLLIQQREVLKELQDQRKGLELSQAARDEIGDLVRSSIKQYLQTAPLPLRVKDQRKGYDKNAKNPNRRRKRTRSEKFDRGSPSESAAGHGSNSPPFRSPPSGTWCHDKTTIVRQRFEQEPEHMDVSLDGYWLPSLSNDNDEARGLWAERIAVAPADAHSLSEARNQAVGRPSCRPATVSLQAPRKSQARHIVPRSLGYKEVTARRCKCFGGASVRRRVESTRRAKPVRSDDPTGSAGGSSTSKDTNDLAMDITHVDREPSSEPALSTLHEVKSCVDDSMKSCSNSDNDNGNGNGNGSSINSSNRSNDDRSKDSGRNNRNGEMSEHQGYKASSGEPVEGEHRNEVVTAMCPNTAAMLERSRALVARAKASCGDAIRSTRGDSSRITEIATSTVSHEGEQASSNLFPVILPYSSENDCPDQQDEVPQTSATRSREKIEVEHDPKVPCSGDAYAEACQDGEGSDRVGALGVVNEEPDEGTRQQAAPGCRGGGTRASVPILQMFPGAIVALEPRTPTQGSASRLRPATAFEKPHGNCATPEETARPGTALVRDSHGVLAREQAGGAAGRQAEGGRACVGNPAKVDSEWENEIAKNILSLYQTKLKDELDKKRGSARQAEEYPRSRRYPVPEEKTCEIDRRDGRSTSACPVGGSRGGRRWEGDERTTRNGSPGKCRPVTAEAHLDVRGGTHRPLGPGSYPRALGSAAGEPGPGGRRYNQRPATVPTITGSSGHRTGKLPKSGATGPRMGRGGFRGSKIISVPTRGGGEAVVVVPKRPTPIWFAGSGTIQAEWSALPGGARVVRDLESLQEHGRYAKYVAVVEGLLAAHLRVDDQREPTELVKRLWRQLVVTCTAFGARCVETKRFAKALELLKRAGVLMSREVLDKRATSELKAFVSDAYGLYYLRRGKSSAALDYVQKAMRVHVYMQDWGHVTKCHLHSGVILSRLNRHDEALRCLGQVLSIVEEGKFDVGGNSPQKLCLVAICYHNIAVEQLILGHAGEACMSSQNARRLARLCLSYSNRWLHSFEGTHKLALAELARSLPPFAGSRLGDTGVGAGGPGMTARGRRTTGGGSAAKTKDDEEAMNRRHFLERLIEELFA